MNENRLNRVVFNNQSCRLCGAAHAARTRIRMASEQDEEEEQVPGEWRRTRLLTQNWFSGTRASYRMQRESDVCESVCEAGVLVHGGRRCRACHLCVCAQRECVCARARNHQQRARAQ